MAATLHHKEIFENLGGNTEDETEKGGDKEPAVQIDGTEASGVFFATKLRESRPENNSGVKENKNDN